MADRLDLKTISKARLKAAKSLMDISDWHGAAYMMAWALECALKAATCKTLNLVTYPENTKKKEIDNYFMTHKFDCLLTVSGLGNTFSPNGPVECFRNWSEFTDPSYLPSNWPEMRYNYTTVWNQAKTERMYNNLTEPIHGIISYMTRKKKW